ncbi:unnamed protein product [Calicophoron daubneyi]|uniref:4-nitrophenylphosphatase n=1 Tax=Calicophoron daubneyi TaxID=300641 RepID=A0AAV2TCV4_CALDB
MSSQNDILRSCNTFLFDCDGVLWNYSEVIPGAPALIKYLVETNRKVYLLTNNSTRSAEQYADKCRKLGLSVTADNIICSSGVAANYLSSQGVRGPVYVLGDVGVGLELDKVGISHFGIGPDHSGDGSLLGGVDLNPNTCCVLVGFDPHINYRKLLKATTYISRGVPFYATNEDAQLPCADYVQPGTGAIVAAVKFAAGCKPIVLGKPHQPVMDVLRRRHSLDPARTIMVGDRLDTDIVFGNRFGLHSACVLTGVTTQSLLDEVKADPKRVRLRPEMEFRSVAEILEELKAADR